MHVVAEFHSTLLHGRTAFPHLMGKNERVCFICIIGRPNLMNRKAFFISKNYFDNYYEATAARKKFLKSGKKFQKNCCETFLFFVGFFIILKLHL